MGGSRVDPLTDFGDYMEATGTQQSWLAAELGISASKVNRWITGYTAISRADAERVLAVLRKRAELPLSDIFNDNLAEERERRPRALRRGGTPFDRALEARLREAG